MDDRIAESNLTTTALCFAAQSGDMNAVKDYLDTGGDINALNAQKHTALYVAMEYRQWAIVEFLLTNNADPFYPNGDTFLHHALRTIDSPERLAMCWQHLSIPQQQELLHTANARGHYPLHEIAARGRVEFMAWLTTVSSEVDWNISTCNPSPGYTPLQFAAAARHILMVERLLRQGADPFMLAEHIAQCHLTERLHWLNRLKRIAEDPRMRSPLLILFSEFLGLQDTIAPKHGYLQCLKQLPPHAEAIAPIVLAISETYLHAKDYLNAMRYAAAAFYYPLATAREPLTCRQIFAAKTMDRILQHYLSSIGHVVSTDICRSQWLIPRQSLERHRQRMTHRLPSFPAPQASSLFSWLHKNSHFFKQFMTTALNEALALCGKPPCAYAVMGLGSLARDEMNLYSDLEYAFLLQKTSPSIRRYFRQVNTLLQLRFIALGETYLDIKVHHSKSITLTRKGFHIDSAFNPINPTLLGTPNQLLRIQQQPASHDERLQQHMLRTVCFLHGNSGLVATYQQHLRNYFTMPTDLQFFLFTTQTLAQKRTLDGMQFDIEHLLPRIHRDKKLTNPFQIKQDFCSLPLQWIGYLALYYQLEETNSYARLKALHQQGYISDAGLRHLADLISQALHLRSMAQVYYQEDRDDAWFADAIRWLNPTSPGFTFPHTDAITHMGYLALSLEAVLQQFVARQGKLNLRHAIFCNTRQEISAQVHVLYRDFFAAETRFLAIHQHQPDDPHVRSKVIQFYATWRHAHQREWAFLQHRGQAWAQQLAQVLMQQKNPYYTTYYSLLPFNCQAAFAASIEQISCTDKKDQLYQKAILNYIRHYSLQPYTLDKETQHELHPLEEQLWQEQCEKADHMGNLAEQNRQLEQLYHDKFQDIGFERTMRRQRKAEHQLALYHRYLQQHASSLQAQEFLCIRLIYCLKTMTPLQQKNMADMQQKLRERIMEFIEDWQRKAASEQEYIVVYQQLDSSTRKLFREKLLDYQDRLVSTSIAWNFLDRLLTRLNCYPDEDGQRADWFTHKQCWQTTLASLVEKPDTKTVKTDNSITLASPLLSQNYTASLQNTTSALPSSQPQLLSTSMNHILKRDIAQTCIQDGTFIEHKINDSQSNIVAVQTYIELPNRNPHKKNSVPQQMEQTLYIKEKPEMPGMTCFVELFHHQCIGHGTSLSELVRITVNDTLVIPVLISESIHGENLNDVLLKNPEKLANLSHRHFSDMALIAMLTNPGDGQPANYVLMPLENGEYTLVSVDHDHALFPAYLIEPPNEKEVKDNKNTSPIPQLQVRSILFCLENMNQPIHPDAREDFCRIDAFQTLRSVLQQTQVQNEYYAKLFKEEEIIALNKKGSSTIPIPIHKEDIIILYQKMRRLQHYLRRHPQATLLQCLMQVEPRVGLAYQHVLAEPMSPRDRLQKIGRYQYDKTDHQITSSQALLTRPLTSSVLSKTDYLALETFSPEGGLAVLDQLHHQQRHLADIQAEVQQGNFRRLTHTLSMQDREIIMGGDRADNVSDTDKTGLLPLEWQTLTLKQQTVLLELMVKKSWQRLYLRDCEALTQEILFQLLHISPELQELHLDGNISQEVNQLAALLNHHPTLRILYMRNMPHLTAFQHIVLPVLDTLVIENSPQLTILNITAPQLCILRAKRCIKLDKIKTNSPKLHYLDCEENTDLTLENLLNITEHYPSLATLKLTDSPLIPETLLLSKHPFLLNFLRMFPSGQNPFFWPQLAAILKRDDIYPYLITLTTAQKDQLYFKLSIATAAILLLEQMALTTKYRHLTESIRIIVFRTVLVSKPELVTQERLRTLWDLCKNENPSIRAGSIQTITTILPAHPTFITHDFLTTLSGQCKDQNSWVREATVQGFTAVLQAKPTLITKYSLNTLLNLYQDKDRGVRIATVQSIVVLLQANPTFITQNSLNTLLDLYNNWDSDIRIAAVRGVNALLQANPTLITQASFNKLVNLYKDKNRDVRIAAIRGVIALLKNNPTFIIQNYINTLWDHCKDKDWRVREATVQEVSALLQANPTLITQNSFSKLVDLYKDTDSNVRIGVVEEVITLLQANSTFITQDSIHTLLGLYRDGYSSNHVQGVSALLQTNPTLITTQDSINMLLDLCKNTDRGVQKAALQEVSALLQTNPTLITQDYLNKLLDLWKDRDRDVRKAAVQAVTTLLLAKPRLINTLGDLCKDQNWRVQEAILQGITILLRIKILIAQDSFNINKLVNLHKDSDAEISAVEKVITFLQTKPTHMFITQDSLNKLLDLYKDNDRDVRKVTVQGISAPLQTNPILITQDYLNKLLDLCKDTDRKIRKAAGQEVSVLLQTNPTLITQDSINTLGDLCKDQDWRVQEAARQGITTLLGIKILIDQDSFNINKLVNLYKDRDSNVQIDVVKRIITCLETNPMLIIPNSINTLLGLYRDGYSSSDVRITAVQEVSALLQANPTFITQDSINMLLDT